VVTPVEEANAFWINENPEKSFDRNMVSKLVHVANLNKAQKKSPEDSELFHASDFLAR